ncbi:SDR family NAD(P)-dependent oxidoreductase [Actinosynnema sp. CS-041913]|uniref:SDR family NAD(P)-dependent oxidoreductase n=1 Tax=Actinosynnema sp. CS-041913 TaxID=3239917 RepID=UPI003D8A42A3
MGTTTSLQGLVALVTGAGRERGIGAATAEHLARAGASVLVSDLVPAGPAGEEAQAGLDATVARVRAAGGHATSVALDVTDATQIEAAVEAAVSAFGRLDVLVNNAGSGIGVAAFAEVTDDQWELSWLVNVMGPMRLSRAALPYLEQQGGSIVNVASTAGIAAQAGYGAYTVTKHAIVGLTRLLAAELGPRGIRVNAVAPGMIHTDLGTAELELIAASSGATVEDTARSVVESIPVRRLGTPDDVAAAIAWLAQPGSYVSGAIVPVTGAMAAGLN